MTSSKKANIHNDLLCDDPVASFSSSDHRRATVVTPRVFLASLILSQILRFVRLSQISVAPVSP